MIKDYLAETYGYNEPIFINEIKLKDTSDNALRQSFKRMVQSGELIRFDTGIYYLPKASRLLSRSYMDPLKVIIRKYIKNDTDTFGYFTGLFFANQLGLTTQIPSVLEIVTNKESTKGRNIFIGNQEIRVKRPAIPANKENADLLQLLEGISLAEKYAEISLEEVKKRILAYIRQKQFTRSQLGQAMPAVTGAAAKKLIEWGIIYEFTS